MADHEGPPKFLLLKEEEHAAARRSEYVAALVEYVEFEQTEAIKAVLHHVRDRKFDEATFKLAKADALGNLIDQFWKTDPAAVAEDDEEFVDPAMPPSVRRRDATRTA